MHKLPKFVIAISLFSVNFAQANQAPKINNPTAHRVFVDQSKAHSLIVVPSGNPRAVFATTEDLVTEQQCESFNSLDNADLEAITGIGAALQDISTKSQEEINQTLRENDQRFAKLAENDETRISQSRAVGGKTTVTYDFGNNDLFMTEVESIRRANPGFSVKVAAFKVNNRQLFFTIPGGLPKTDTDFRALPLVLDYKIGNFTSADLSSRSVTPGKTMTIKNGQLAVEFTISRRAACYFKQNPSENLPFNFSMSLHQTAIYCAFPPSEVDPQIYTSLDLDRNCQ